MGEQLTKIALWVATGGLIVIAISVVCYLLYEAVDAVRYGEYLYGLIFFVLAIFAVSLSLLVIGKIV